MKKILLSMFTLLCLNAFSQKETSASVNQVPYGNNSKAGHYVQSGDAKIYYEIYGNGQPIVILHGGIVGSIDEMHQFIDSFSKSYQ